ncbi:MAG: orotidine-5'-phosphate decarboxylase [Alphaproteobacteria bacterium]|nr:orotidine-5'-phosphate decarboxylase [Alphaproteobacteria bacterium]
MANPVFVALDTPDIAQAVDLATQVADAVGGIKLGLEFVNANGPEGIRKIAECGLPVFLDLKFHDIPNTVAGAIRAVIPLAPRILNVHAGGGAAMMTAARDAADAAARAHGVAKPLVIAVTVLTSLDGDDLTAVGQIGPAATQARRLAVLARDCGLDGVVCSAREARDIRAACGPDFTLVVPGIRPSWSASDDQKRVASPAEAMRDGATYLVIGRPITEAPDPADAARRIVAELADGTP